LEKYIRSKKNKVNISKLIINESYWQLFESEKFKTQSYMIPDPDVLKNTEISIAEYTKNLCLLLQNRDKNKFSLYGIEIKTNGSSRSGRIPLVRLTKNKSKYMEGSK